jgi:hypothetical protein
MGLGDYIHWTAIIRDLYTELNLMSLSQINIFVSKINTISNNTGYGITKIVSNILSIPFKFYVNIQWKGNVICHDQASIIFKNNPYISNDESYPNLIYITIKSDGYLDRKMNGDIIKIYDDKHVVTRYAEHFKLNSYKTEGDIHFTKDEISKVEAHLPNTQFILVEPQNHKDLESRNISFEFMQNLVNKIKYIYGNNLNIIQISPHKFANKESKYLDNCIVFKDYFSYREALLFGKHALLAIVPHGGLSIGLAAVNTKVIAIYPCIHKVQMTTYKSETVYEISDGTHYSCYLSDCNICKSLRIKFDKNNLNKIIDSVKSMV